jgi:hypothetical protein
MITELLGVVMYGAGFVFVYHDGRLDERYGVRNRGNWSSLVLWGVGGLCTSIGAYLAGIGS